MLRWDDIKTTMDTLISICETKSHKRPFLSPAQILLLGLSDFNVMYKLRAVSVLLKLFVKSTCNIIYSTYIIYGFLIKMRNIWGFV